MAGIGPVLAGGIRALARRAAPRVTETGAVLAGDAAKMAAARTPNLLSTRIPLRALQKFGGEAGTQIATGIEASRSTVEREFGGLLADTLPTLRSLNPGEQAELSALLRGQAIRASPRVKAIATRAQPLFSEVQDVMIRVGGKRVAATPDAILARATLTGRVTPKIERDATQLFTILADEATDLRLSRRLRELRPLARQLGSQNRALGDLAETIISRIQNPPDAGAATAMVRNLNVFTLLGRAVIPNLSQSAITALTIGIRPTIKALARQHTDEAAAFALRSGAILESIQDELLGGLQRTLSEKAARELLRVTGFNAVERFNRRVAAVAAREALPDLVRGASRGNKRALNMLKRLGLNPDEILRRGGAVTDEEALRAGQRLSRLTQFRTTVEELPEFATRDDAGRLIFQFKSFAVKAFEATFDQAKIDPAGTILRGALVLPTAGFAVRATQIFADNAFRLATGDVDGFKRQFAQDFERKMGTSTTRQVLESLAAVGALGILADAVKSSLFGVEGALEFLVGPTVSAGAEAGVQALRAAIPRERQTRFGPETPPLGERLAPLGRQALRRIPALGPTVSRELFPPREPSPIPGRRRRTFPQ